MAKNRGYCVIGQWVIADEQLYPSTKRVLAGMLSSAGRKLTLRKKSHGDIAALCHCSRSTVQQALRQLRERGLIKVKRRYHWSPSLGRIVYAASDYRISPAVREGRYTMFSRDVLTAKISHSAFVIALHHYCYAGREGRSYSSIRHTSHHTDLSHATVCRALRQLSVSQVLSILHCKKHDGGFACNSSYPIGWVRKQKADSSAAVGGSLIFSQPPGSKKDNEKLLQQKEYYGVGEFGDLYNIPGGWMPESQFYFDGTGVRVSVPDELDITA